MPERGENDKSAVEVLLKSPWLAVAVAFVVRYIALRTYMELRSAKLLFLPTIGTEAGLVAHSIATGKGFAGLWFGLEGPTAWITPIYPYLIAGVYKLADMDDALARTLMQGMNCLFSGLTCWPLHAVAKRIFGQRIGLVSAWIWVFLPMAIQIPLEWIWDQSLDALLLCFLIWITLELRESKASVLVWSCYGLLWAIVALCNPVLCLAMPFYLWWLIRKRQPQGRETWAYAQRTMLFFVLALLPWTIRNYKVMHALVPVKSNFGLELYLGNNSSVKHVWNPELHPLSNQQALRELAEHGEIEFNRMRQREALQFIAANPGRFLQLCAERVLDTWTSWYEADSEVWLKILKIQRPYVVFYAAFALLAFFGAYFARRMEGHGSSLLIVPMGVFPLVYYITHSNAHYRHAIDPVMAILVAYGVMRFVGKEKPLPVCDDSLQAS